MTFLELAKYILLESDKPLSANEIWEFSIVKGINKKLVSKGKTPSATLGARLYVTSKDTDSEFKSIGKRPKRFYLKSKKYDISFEDYESGLITEEILPVSKIKKEKKFLEKDLHPLLAHFAFYNLGCYTKTINHSKSTKKSYGEWVHPDMVGCVFPIEEWESEVIELSAAIGDVSVKFISFELKRVLNLSTLREKFFQTVSNSSWANESYLVAAEISDETDFRSELARLSTAFGIGVIHLNLEDITSTEIIHHPRFKDSLDWETINKLTMNKDFKQFLKRIKIDLQSNEIRKERYDKVLKDEELQNKFK